MAKLDFINQLQALDYTVQEPASGFVSFEYEISVGKFAGKKVWMGLQVLDSFPMNAPPGPHFKTTSFTNIGRRRYASIWGHPCQPIRYRMAVLEQAIQ